MSIKNTQAKRLAGEHLRLAREAYERYGKGPYPATLNPGDCCAYALSRRNGELLLFEGSDFPLAEVVPIQ